jgi:DNA polymerase
LGKNTKAEFLEQLAVHLELLRVPGADFVVRDKSEAAPAGAAGPEPGTQHVPEEGSGLERLSRLVLECRRCPLAAERTRAVPGEGHPRAELMFVGEGPGRDEDAQGRPFVGRAGQLLRRIIAAMKFREDEVYITNVVKCRPPENRVPRREEVEACAPYLLEQIRLIQPRVIVSLGKTPTEFFMPSGHVSMSSLRGRFADFQGIMVMPTFHPSYLVRNEGNRELKRMVWEDMQKVMEFLGRK